MARLYCSATSDRTRGKGRTLSGQREISAHARGWNDGARVAVKYVGGKTHVSVYRTGGSFHANRETLVCTWAEGEPVILNATLFGERGIIV